MILGIIGLVAIVAGIAAAVALLGLAIAVAFTEGWDVPKERNENEDGL